MSEADEKMSIDLESDSTNKSSEKEAKNEKHKNLNEIRNMMEFYFSDSNLSKDRFLKQQIADSKDGFIDLATFLRFNKIRSLTSDEKLIYKALKKSEVLELNESKTMVRRKVAFIEPSQNEIDKRTIYVENLDPNLKSELLKKYFQQFGRIGYISLPKFKTTNQLKGFSFIEFEEKESAKKAAEFYKGKMSEDEIRSLGKFPKFNAQIIELEKKIQKIMQSITEYENENDHQELPEKETRDAKKRSISESDQYQTESDPKQRLKTQNEKTKTKPGGDEKNLEDHFKSLKVVRKKKWLQLKEDYLERQKDQVKSLKENLESLNKKLDELKQSKETKNFKVKTDDISKGSIIKIIVDLNNPDHFNLVKLTRQKFKESRLSNFLDKVVYVDLEKNSNRILIRCKSSEVASDLLKNEEFLKELDNKKILTGTEEDDYLKKIFNERTKKQEKKDRKQTSKDHSDNQKNLKQSAPKCSKEDYKVKNELQKVSNKASSSSATAIKKHIVFDNDDN